jgi:hypothetical protein
MKQVLSFTFSFLFMILWMFSSAQEISDPVKMFPGNDDFKNWKLKDSVEFYNGENLFSYINGGADIYLEYGFDKVASCKYLNFASQSIHVEIYKMTSDTAAFGIYTISSSPKGKVISLGNKGLLYDYYLDFWKGSYFVRCSSSIKEVSSIDTLLLFASFVDDKITTTGKEPLLAAVLKIDGIDFYNIKYITGLIALSNVFNFGHGAIAGFTEGIIGYSNDKMLFTFSYASDLKCREWFASAKGKMQMNQKFRDYIQKDKGFTIKDKAGTDFCFIPYKRYIIIFKGMNWEEAQALFEQIKKNLK